MSRKLMLLLVALVICTIVFPASALAEEPASLTWGNSTYTIDVWPLSPVDPQAVTNFGTVYGELARIWDEPGQIVQFGAFDRPQPGYLVVLNTGPNLNPVKIEVRTATESLYGRWLVVRIVQKSGNQSRSKVFIFVAYETEPGLRKIRQIASF